MRFALKTVLLCVLLFAGCASTTALTTNAANGTLEQIRTEVMKPAGNGPFPAVVIMHDCSGLGPRSSGSPMRWARQLVDNGYVIAIPDSFSTRGFPNGVCTDPAPGRRDVGPDQRVADAYAALAHLRTLPYVDGSRIAIMGGSHGGSTTLASVAAPQSEGEPLAQEKQHGFRAAVAFYPGCAAPYGSWRTVRQGVGTASTLRNVGVYKPVAPLLILIGEEDDWTPAEPCRRMVEISRREGYPASIKVYPGAHHAFDSNAPVRYNPARINANSPTGRGATTGGDPQAWDDSVREVVAFFAEHLKKPIK
jgi:dienelactone hydrolase